MRSQRNQFLENSPTIGILSELANSTKFENWPLPKSIVHKDDFFCFKHKTFKLMGEFSFQACLRDILGEFFLVA